MEKGKPTNWMGGPIAAASLPMDTPKRRGPIDYYSHKPVVTTPEAVSPGLTLKEPNDPTNPDHYTRYKIQPLQFIQENDLPFWLGNVIKYSLRFDAKDGVQDLKKAKRYLEAKIAHLEGERNWLDGNG